MHFIALHVLGHRAYFDYASHGNLCSEAAYGGLIVTAAEGELPHVVAFQVLFHLISVFRFFIGGGVTCA